MTPILSIPNKIGNNVFLVFLTNMLEYKKPRTVAAVEVGQAKLARPQRIRDASADTLYQEAPGLSKRLGVFL